VCVCVCVCVRPRPPHMSCGRRPCRTPRPPGPALGCPACPWRRPARRGRRGRPAAAWRTSAPGDAAWLALGREPRAHLEGQVGVQMEERGSQWPRAFYLRAQKQTKIRLCDYSNTITLAQTVLYYIIIILYLQVFKRD